ncbi:FixH family protein [Primorskyibacter sp. 2E107]|uniref:FixH family protein n=1 Tax=Primorskyibacter sp. 2E107 TaxID=3403458 RepID=UPI003AF7D77F
MAKAKERKLTGWHVLGIFGGAFGVIIAVNLALAYNAVKTFPGLEVANSYVASQTFNDRKAAQESLGWDIKATLDDGMLLLSITDEAGRPVQAGKLEAKVGRPTNVSDDLNPDFNYNGREYVAYVDLHPGNWDVWLKAVSLDGIPFEQRLEMTIGG